MPFSPSINVNSGGSSHTMGPANAGARPGQIRIMTHLVTWHRHRVVGSGVVKRLESSWDRATLMPNWPDGRGYDSLDPASIIQHNADLASYGMEGMASWWARIGEPSQESGDLFLDAYLEIPSLVQLSLVYEVTGRLRATGLTYDFNDPFNRERFISDMEHLSRRYFNDPRYKQRFYHIDGRPVVFLWLSHASVGPFDEVVRQLRKTTDIYLIGAEYTMFAPGRPEIMATIRGLDAISSYGIYSSVVRSTGGHVNGIYVDTYIKAAILWSQWLSVNAPDVKLMLPMQFSYYDTRGNQMMVSTRQEAHDQATAIRALIEQSAKQCGNIVPQVLHVSKNEAYEGSSIEPSKSPAVGPEGALNWIPNWNPDQGYFAEVIKDVFSAPLINDRSCANWPKLGE